MSQQLSVKYNRQRNVQGASPFSGKPAEGALRTHGRVKPLSNSETGRNAMPEETCNLEAAPPLLPSVPPSLRRRAKVTKILMLTWGTIAVLGPCPLMVVIFHEEDPSKPLGRLIGAAAFACIV